MNSFCNNNLLTDILRAECFQEDLQEGPHGLHVCAMRQDGSLYDLGSVSYSFVYQRPEKALYAIERIKFNPRHTEGTTCNPNAAV